MNEPSTCEIERLVNHLLDYFRSGEYCRMRSTDLNRLKTSFRICLLLEKPLQLLSYWGIGTRTTTEAGEADALAYLEHWLAELQALGGFKTQLEFLITDTHGSINEIPNHIIECYSRSAERLLGDHGYACTLMSDFIAERMGSSAAHLLTSFCLNDQEWSELPSSWTRELERCAAFRAQRRDRSKLIARKYYMANLLESTLVTDAKPDRVFLTYQSPGFEFLLPSLPKIFAYVGPGKTVQRPWFSDDMRGHTNVSD